MCHRCRFVLPTGHNKHHVQYLLYPLEKKVIVAISICRQLIASAKLIALLENKKIRMLSADAITRYVALWNVGRRVPSKRPKSYARPSFYVADLYPEEIRLQNIH